LSSSDEIVLAALEAKGLTDGVDDGRVDGSGTIYTLMSVPHANVLAVQVVGVACSLEAVVRALFSEVGKRSAAA
jgi:hypothetical protein